MCKTEGSSHSRSHTTVQERMATRRPRCGLRRVRRGDTGEGRDRRVGLSIHGLLLARRLQVGVCPWHLRQQEGLQGQFRCALSPTFLLGTPGLWYKYSYMLIFTSNAIFGLNCHLFFSLSLDFIFTNIDAGILNLDGGFIWNLFLDLANLIGHEEGFEVSSLKKKKHIIMHSFCCGCTKAK